MPPRHLLRQIPTINVFTSPRCGSVQVTSRVLQVFLAGIGSIIIINPLWTREGCKKRKRNPSEEATFGSLPSLSFLALLATPMIIITTMFTGVPKQSHPPRYLLLVLVFLLLLGSAVVSDAATVTYDHRAVVIDGQRRVLISGSIHYPRSTPESKDGGLDVIETYVFWNLHEPVRGQYDFEGRKDLVGFVKAVGEAGLYVTLRIGPYVCAEWNYGGFPVWLHFIPGIKMRTDNEPFKLEMQRFTAKIVDMMKQENLFASQGGPIILAQIENEYGNVEAAYGPAAKAYVNWAASMATSLDTGVPWVMCQQEDAPDDIINTCNGFYCDQFTPNSNKKPKIWTENWSGWFLSFGGGVPYRPVEDLAFAVARFFQRGGTFQNYYMYHGGTNFGRSTGGPFIATSYDYDAPIDEYGIVRQPKWGHLRDLHQSIKLCSAALVATDAVYSALGSNLEAHVYKAESGACAAFIANTGTQSAANVTFNGNSYHIPAWSVSILPDCRSVVFNTAQANNLQFSSSPVAIHASWRQRIHQTINSQFYKLEDAYFKPSFHVSDKVYGSNKISQSGWSWVIEPVGISKASMFRRTGLLEQISTTADASDYLWYSVSFDIKGDELFLSNGTLTPLHIRSLGHILHVFVNGNLIVRSIGSANNAKVALDQQISLLKGNNSIDLLSVTVGLQNYGAFFDELGAGITGPVTLGGNGAAWNLSSSQWTYQVGLKGEELKLYENSPESSSQWVSLTDIPRNQPLIWYKTIFDAPEGSDPVAIDFTGMGKGEAWVNGQSIGRYWPTYLSQQNGCSNCSFQGSFGPNKCLRNCGKPSQHMYHVPRSMIQPSGNTLVLFEEMGGDPTQLDFATRQVESLCAHVSELNPPPMDLWSSNLQPAKKSGAKLHLECPNSQKTISSIRFASFGTPLGACGSFSHGKCSSKRALAIVQKACIGSRNCSVDVSAEVFGDPCKGITKSLAVEASCS